jgi:RsmE family RNA methyltransferase
LRRGLNLILLFPGDVLPGTDRVRLDGRRLRHVLSVHRAAVGDELCVGMLGGRIGAGRVLALDDERLEMQVALDRKPPAPLPLTLLLALPRPKVLRRVLRSVAALGAKRIVLLNAARVEKSYWQSPLLAPAAVAEQLALGLEQARDTILPTLEQRRLFRPFVEDELPAWGAGTLRLVAHPPAAAPCPRGVSGPVTLAIGPEGGFVPYEVEKLQACGFEPVGLGARVLSVETAVPALLSRLF